MTAAIPIVSPAGEGEANTAFGLPRRFKVTAEQSGGALAVWEEEVPPGAGPPLHIHHAEQELFAVLDGRLRFRCGETTVELETGGTLLIPAGAPHAFKALGTRPSRLLITMTPGGAERFFRAVEAENLAGPQDKARIDEIAAAHGITFVGPPID